MLNERSAKILMPLLLAALSLQLMAAHTDVLSRIRAVHQRLLYKNTFADPKKVVEYYCARDASGFVWSGILDIERRAFTTWKSTPVHESFYIAKSYKLGESKIFGKKKDQALVKVQYELTGMGDAHGTKLPAPTKRHEVTFKLKKVKGQWKIASPESKKILAVVLEDKFPYAN